MSNHIEEASRPFIVCPTCKGNGTHGPGWVMTQADVDEMGYDEFDEYMENMQEGRYDVPCEECKGQRVVKGECPCSSCEEDREDEYQMRELERMERMYC